MTRWLALLAACLITVTGVSACGDDDDTPAPTGTSGRGGAGGRRAGGTGGGDGVSGVGGDAASGEGAAAAGGTTQGGRSGAGGRAGNPATGGRSGSSGRLAGGGAGGDNTDLDGGVSGPPIDSLAANLRVTLALLFSEHVALTSRASGASLAGRSDEFNAYYDQVRDNGLRIGDYIGLFEGQASSRFAELWGAHDLAFVNYTKAVAAENTEKQTEALGELRDRFVPQFAAFLHGTSDLSEELLTQLTTAQVDAIKAVIDAQHGDDWTRIFELQHTAYANMLTFSDAVSLALVERVPHVFTGDPVGKDVDFRLSLNDLLQEHVYLATWTTAATRGERTLEADAARAALGENRASIALVFDSYYNAQAVDRFNAIWNSHNGALIDYGTEDGSDRESADTILTTSFVPMFADLIHETAGLPISDVRMFGAEHITRLKAAIDFIVAENLEQAALADIAAAQYMVSLGDPLSRAIVAQQPDRF
ncbi:MAG: hypothetical protein ABW321_11255 [Polyangiales bacterium]